ncbi:hypothetical protein YN1HA_29940 [Sulfurisphaera ohwakuensis]
MGISTIQLFPVNLLIDYIMTVNGRTILKLKQSSISKYICKILE